MPRPKLIRMAVIVPPKDPERPIAPKAKPGEKPKEQVQKAKDSSRPGVVPDFGGKIFRSSPIRPGSPKIPEFLRNIGRNLAAKLKRAVDSREAQIFAVVILLAFVVSVSGPRISGLVTGLAADEQNLTTQLISCQSNASSLQSAKNLADSSAQSQRDINNQLSRQIQDYADTIRARDASLGSCASDLANAKNDTVTASLKVSVAQSDLNKTQDQLARAQLDVNILAQNYANRYCCQLKQLGFNYNAFTVADNNVICLQTGTKALNCTA